MLNERRENGEGRSRKQAAKEKQKWMLLFVPIKERFAAMPEWAQGTVNEATVDTIQNEIIVVTNSQKAVAA